MPKVWQEALATEDELKGETSMPSVPEMQTGLLKLAKGQSRKLFLFIDGLDEQDGRPKDAATCFRSPWTGQMTVASLLV